MSPTYDSRTVAYHWVSAVLVLGLWTLGQTIDWFPRGDARSIARSSHIVLGALLAAVLVMRLLWRRSGGAKLPVTDPGLQGQVAVWMHYLLYVLMVAIVVLGFASVWFRGDTIFWLLKIPAFDPSNKELRKTAVDLHGLLANIMLSLAALHAGAALWHHFVTKDSVLRRMWPSAPDQGR